MFGLVLLWLFATYGDSTGTVQDVIAILGLVGLPSCWDCAPGFFGINAM